MPWLQIKPGLIGESTLAIVDRSKLLFTQISFLHYFSSDF